MPETIDPYLTLGVARTATRAEVGRAYRALAKRWHPDTAATGSEREMHAASMARLNQAWNILSDPARRAKWDMAHPVSAIPHWVREPMRTDSAGMPTWRPPIAERVVEAPAGPRSIRESGWLAIGVVLVTGAVVSGALAAMTWQPVPQSPPPVAGLMLPFDGDGLALNHPPEWAAFAGEGDRGADAAVVVHLVSDPTVSAADACTDSSMRCDLALDELDEGDVSVVITRWQDGPPPVANPDGGALPGGLVARVLGGTEAVHRAELHAGGTAAWWQLSPPDFPNRWFEAYAWIPGDPSEVADGIRAVEAVLSTVTFTD